MDAKTLFHLGVAYRMRYDSDRRQPSDFAKAAEAWQSALKLNPRQYIWRRRIQQYGPRLDKPYSFYDWVHQARAEIIERGENPHPLTAEPSGSEFARPGKTEVAQSTAQHPDPQGKLPADSLGLVQVEAIAIPSTDRSKPAYRIHLRFRPSAEKKVHWTNDAGRLSFFPESHPSFAIHDRQPDPPLPDKPTTSEERSLEFEIRPTKTGAELPETFRGAAFYYVCEDVNGFCQFLRQDIVIPLK